MHFAIDFILIFAIFFPIVGAIGFLLLSHLSNAVSSRWLCLIGMAFCPVWETREIHWMEDIDGRLAEDDFFGEELR